MNLINRIENLSLTKLPEDLLKVLYFAKQEHTKGNIVRSNSLIQVIEIACKQQDIEIHDDGNKRIDYRKIKMYENKKAEEPTINLTI